MWWRMTSTSRRANRAVSGVGRFLTPAGLSYGRWVGHHTDAGRPPGRVTFWLFTPGREAISLVDWYDKTPEEHSSDLVLMCSDFPTCFAFVEGYPPADPSINCGLVYQ